MGVESNKNVRVVACVVRPDPLVDLGIAFNPDLSLGCLIIASVSPNGLFAKTGLQVNQKLVKISGRNCVKLSKNKLEKALDLLNNATGLITLEAESMSTDSSTSEEVQFFSIQKLTKTFKLGIELETIEAPDDQLRITKASPTLERVLGLKPGLQLISINGRQAQVNDIPGVLKTMDSAFPMLTLECRVKEVNPNHKVAEIYDENTRVVACISRPETFLELGISFLHDTERDCLAIKAIAHNGLFAKTGLKVNQKVVKINGRRISKKNYAKAEEIMTNATGFLIIEAVSFSGPPTLQQSTIYERQTFSIQKTKKNFQLGLGLEQLKTPDGFPSGLRIVSALPLCERILGLKPGLRLLKVNGVACDVNDIDSVHQQMNEAFPILSLECLQEIKILPNVGDASLIITKSSLDVSACSSANTNPS